MKYSFVAAALAAPIVLAAPAKRQATNIDTTVLQFALTLEHLENVFYKGALQQFKLQDFINAGYGVNYYNNIRYIASDEESHVEFLSAALAAAGQTPTAACTYNFPYTDVASFITLSSILEGVGTSAYLGGAPLITSKDYLTAAGSILVTEALHTSLQRGAVNEIPFGNPYGTPLDPTSVYTLAAAFIKSCPSTNPVLPFTPFPSLALATVAGTCEQPDCSPYSLQKRGDEESSDWENNEGEYEQGETEYHESYEGSYEGSHGGSNGGMDHYSGSHGGNNGGMDHYSGSHGGNNGGYGNQPAAGTKNQAALQAGQTASFTAASAVPAGSYLTFVSGLSVVSIPASVNGNSASAAIPAIAMGQTYVFVTSAAAAGKLDGASVLFGPAILEVAPASPSIDFSEA